MEDVLLTKSKARAFYLHGTIRSSTANVRNTFDQQLNETLQMQNRIYSKMSEKAQYPMETAQTQQIDKVRQKYTCKRKTTANKSQAKEPPPAERRRIGKHAVRRQPPTGPAHGRLWARARGDTHHCGVSRRPRLL